MNPGTSDSLRILVVEDNADALQMLCELLDLLGHKTCGAPDAGDALARLAEQEFDVLLTDVNLPGQSGIELARRVRVAAPGMRIIFASGHDESMLSHIDFAAAWLTKPYELATLMATLSQSDSA